MAGLNVNGADAREVARLFASMSIPDLIRAYGAYAADRGAPSTGDARRDAGRAGFCDGRLQLIVDVLARRGVRYHAPGMWTRDVGANRIVGVYPLFLGQGRIGVGPPPATTDAFDQVWDFDAWGDALEVFATWNGDGDPPGGRRRV